MTKTRRTTQKTKTSTSTPDPWSAEGGAVGKEALPAYVEEGETLVSKYDAKLKVREKRAKAAPRANKPGDGAQSSPELAALAGQWINAKASDFLDLGLTSAEHTAVAVRSLAAAVLRLVRE
jgi:hypothetical protein